MYRCCSPSRPTTRNSQTPAASTQATRYASRASTSGTVQSTTDRRQPRLGGFTLGVHHRHRRRLAIRTDTLLGKRHEVESRGSRPLPPSGMLPVGQSTTPYQIYDAFFDVTKAAERLGHRHRQAVAECVVADLDQTYPHLSAALDGVAKFSDTIGKRDEEVQASAGSGQPGGQHPRRWRRTNQQPAGQRQHAAGRVQRTRSGHRRTAGKRHRVSRPSCEGLINDNPDLTTCSSSYAPSPISWSSARTTWPTRWSRWALRRIAVGGSCARVRTSR